MLLIATGLCAGNAAAQPSINVGDTSGSPGQTVTFSVTLSNAGVAVVGTQNDISFASSSTPIAAFPFGNCAITVGQSCATDVDCPMLPPPVSGNEPCVNLNGPACTVNPAIGKGGLFAFEPTGCSGSTCTAMRALIVSLSDTTTPIPNGTLYTCTLDIAANAAPGTYPLTASGIYMVDTAPQAVPGATGTNGSVTVLGPVACIGDCNGSGGVTPGELLIGLDILLSKRDLSDCNAWGGDVTPGKLLQGLNNALNGCP